MKTCTKCKESKELEDFPINLRMKIGHFDDDIDLLLQAIKYLKEAKHGKQAA